MGKGGTRFVGDAVGVRAGKWKGYSSKEMAKDMETYRETGVHPEVERMRQKASEAVQPLPEKSTARQYVFLDLHAGGKSLGRLVIELFDDVAPAAAAHFRNRCSEGATDTFKGTALHKVIRQLGGFGGLSPKYRPGVHIRRYPSLRHVDRGAVSVAVSGAEFFIAVSRVLQMDETHQVVGRVAIGEEILDTINDMQTGPDDAPLKRVVVARCGFTNADGTHEVFDEVGSSGKKETPEETAARVAAEAAEARDSVKEALQTGLSRKRAAEPAKAGAKPPPKKTMLDSMLGDLSGSDSDGSDEAAKEDEGG